MDVVASYISNGVVGSESVLAYITTMGKIFGQDLRSQEVAWKLSTMPKYGNICTYRVYR